MDFAKHIPTIEKKISYSFRDKSLLRQAFTRTSYCNEKNYKGRENYSSNEVLEFFGDSVLSTAIISLLLNEKTERYVHGIKTDLTEGDLSNIRSKLSDKRNLSRSTAELGLQKYLLLGEGDEKLMISEEASVMEDLFESIIGAVYIDCGMDIKTVIRVVEGMLDISTYRDGEAPIQSYKNALQEWCADKSRRLPAPVYKTVSESGPDHKKVYERACYIGDKIYGVGSGKNLKLADTAAAEAALIALKHETANAECDIKDAARALRSYAGDKKLGSPEYHDLGEAPESTGSDRIYIVECCLAGKVASGSGRSKNEARESASAKILSELKSNTKGKNTAAKQKTKGARANATGKVKPTTKTAAESGDVSHKVKHIAGAASQAPTAKVKAHPAAKSPSQSTSGARKSDRSPSPKRTPHHHTKRS